ncbi:DUF2552 family protein [Ectobacillus antri]|jgi:hypothetical protein|uniref:DUF2552 family protein n=1 Tax=Ectobacillus antri TaxID=2486280 RepID=A0ABT6H4S0_9BACI|nr:DUF2552 family protein [Ectobacillus antri]MDG4655673.1 DUF2552 family protein [Ectobacillus antri]MDG5753431.1 DUF2552 family protein [Ectobacillus antri]
MNETMHTLKNVAAERTWVSFLHNDHPYSLLHWSIAGTQTEQKDIWLLQDEVSFETKEFQNLDEAILWIGQNMHVMGDELA